MQRTVGLQPPASRRPGAVHGGATPKGTRGQRFWMRRRPPRSRAGPQRFDAWPRPGAAMASTMRGFRQERRYGSRLLHDARTASWTKGKFFYRPSLHCAHIALLPPTSASPPRLWRYPEHCLTLPATLLFAGFLSASLLPTLFSPSCLPSQPSSWTLLWCSYVLPCSSKMQPRQCCRCLFLHRLDIC